MGFEVNEHAEFIAALFPTYGAAHQAVQSLYDKGYVNFTVSYVQSKFDEAIDGEGGFYPDHTPDVQIPREHDATEVSNLDVPQTSALSNSGSERTPLSLHERLDAIGFPQDYTNTYLNSITQGQVLCVIRPHANEQVQGIMSELTHRANSIHNFPGRKN